MRIFRMPRFILLQALWCLVTVIACICSIAWMRRNLRRAERHFSYGLLELLTASLVLLPAWINAVIAVEYWQMDAVTGMFSMMKALNFLVSILLGAALGRVSGVLQAVPVEPSTWKSAAWVGAGGVAGFLFQVVLFLLFGFASIS
jgi:hypothetical protein